LAVAAKGSKGALAPSGSLQKRHFELNMPKIHKLVPKRLRLFPEPHLGAIPEEI